MSYPLGSIPPNYKPLYEHLSKRREEGHTSWHTTFTGIEEVIGDSLPLQLGRGEYSGLTFVSRDVLQRLGF